MSNEITRQEFDEFRRDFAEFKELVQDAFNTLVNAVNSISEMQARTISVLDEHSEALASMGVKLDSVEELSKMTVEYAQAWAQDVKDIKKHLGI